MLFLSDRYVGEYGIKINEVTPYVDGGIYCDCEEQENVSHYVDTNEQLVSVYSERQKQNNGLLVRARVEGDIENVFPKARVKADIGTDYKYRAFIPKWVVSEAIKKSIENIDYDNFKNSVPLDDTARHDAYLQIWDILFQLQFQGKNKFK